MRHSQKTVPKPTLLVHVLHFEPKTSRLGTVDFILHVEVVLVVVPTGAGSAKVRLLLLLLLLLKRRLRIGLKFFGFIDRIFGVLVIAKWSVYILPGKDGRQESDLAARSH